MFSQILSLQGALGTSVVVNPPVTSTNNENLYLSTSLDFISHEENTGVVATINRAFPDDSSFDNNLEVFYTISGTGTNEASITSGSAIIPSGKSYVEIPINPINDPASVTADRELTIAITPVEGYRIANDFGYDKGTVTIAVKDELPTKAFPTAYGAGAYAKGGRGGNVYHVTRLDDVSPFDGVPLEGQYRWALQQARPATIVFDVSGTVILEYTLLEDLENLTIAGQSAPVGGITISDDGGLASNNARYDIGADGTCDNAIMRYMRFRPQMTSKGNFAIYSNTGTARNMIFDHLSFSWSGNSNFGTVGNLTQNITLQRSLLAESKVGSLMTNSQNHEYTTNISSHNNLYYNNSHRTPNNGANGRVDNINNVVQNWVFRLSYINGDNRYNHLNNYYAMGGRTYTESTGGQLYINFLDTSFGAKTTATSEDTYFDYEVYTSGNIVDKNMHGLADDNRALWGEFDGVYQTYVTTDENNPQYPFINTQHELIGDSQSKLPIQTATEFYTELITNPDIGANASLNADGSVTYSNDYVDDEYLAVMAGGEGSFEAYTTSSVTENRSYWAEQRYIDFVANLTSTPVNTRPGAFYVSNAHVPEAYLIAKGLPQNATVHNDVNADGYTILEQYLNEVDTPIEIINVTNVSIEPATASVTEGGTQILTTTFTPSNASDKSGTWSSNSANATVSGGNVTGVTEGSATITFVANDTTNGTFSDTSTITVTASTRPNLLATYSNESTTNTVTVTATPTSGNYLIAGVAKGNFKDDSITPTGWALIHETNSSFNEHKFYGKLSDGTETSVVFENTSTGGGGNIQAAIIYEFENVNNTTPYESLNVEGRVQATNHVIDAITSTSDNSLAIMFYNGVTVDDITNSITVAPTEYTQANSTVFALSTDAWMLLYSAPIETATIIADNITLGGTRTPYKASIALVLKPE